MFRLTKDPIALFLILSVMLLSLSLIFSPDMNESIGSFGFKRQMQARMTRISGSEKYLMTLPIASVSKTLPFLCQLRSLLHPAFGTPILRS
jgi:hypothetical protein